MPLGTSSRPKEKKEKSKKKKKKKSPWILFGWILSRKMAGLARQSLEKLIVHQGGTRQAFSWLGEGASPLDLSRNHV